MRLLLLLSASLSLCLAGVFPYERVGPVWTDTENYSGTVKVILPYPSNSQSDVSTFYLGGNLKFKAGNCQPCDGVGRFDGTTYHQLGIGLYGSVHTMSLMSAGVPDRIFLGGYFSDHVNGSRHGVSNAWNNVAIYDALADQLLPMGAGLCNGTILASVVTTRGVYAGGSHPGALSLWDGATWTTVVSNLQPHERISTIVASEVNTLLLGGIFGAGLNSIASFNEISGQWTPLGNGVLGQHDSVVTVNAVELHNSDEIIVGHANGLSRFRVSTGVWDSDLGRVYGGVTSLVSVGTGIYVGGVFASAALLPSTQGLAYSDGLGRWQPVNGSIFGVYAVAVQGRYLLFGGGFVSVKGNTDINHIARVEIEAVAPADTLAPTTAPAPSGCTTIEGDLLSDTRDIADGCLLVTGVLTVGTSLRMNHNATLDSDCIQDGTVIIRAPPVLPSKDESIFLPKLLPPSCGSRYPKVAVSRTGAVGCELLSAMHNSPSSTSKNDIFILIDRTNCKPIPMWLLIAAIGIPLLLMALVTGCIILRYQRLKLLAPPGKQTLGSRPTSSISLDTVDDSSSSSTLVPPGTPLNSSFGYDRPARQVGEVDTLVPIGTPLNSSFGNDRPVLKISRDRASLPSGVRLNASFGSPEGNTLVPAGTALNSSSDDAKTY